VEQLCFLPEPVKTQKVLVLTKTKASDAEAAGADYVGAVELIQKIQKENWFDFDVIIATPEMMAELGKNWENLRSERINAEPKNWNCYYGC
jgi:large subunit ribosomal protein L1